MALSTQELDEALALARGVVGEATALLREVGRGEVGRVSSKSNIRDLVTEWDTRIEDLLRERLTRATPDIPLLAEERGGTAGAGAERRWLIDPIDGTVNFSHGIPIYGVTVALEEAGRPVVGVVAAPALGWESWARRGGGAFDEQGRRMAVSGITELERAILSTGFPYDRATTGTNFAEWEHFQRRAGACRRLGAASLDLCMVARGQLDGYWETRLQPWDSLGRRAAGRGSRRGRDRHHRRGVLVGCRQCGRLEWCYPSKDARRAGRGAFEIAGLMRICGRVIPALMCGAACLVVTGTGAVSLAEPGAGGAQAGGAQGGGAARAGQGGAHRGSRVDVEAAQAMLAVQGLDGWLLAQPAGAKNPIAAELVQPSGPPTRRWFYFIPRSGQPVALVHKSETADFDHVPGSKIEYTGYRDLTSGLRTVLRGAHRVAMEYAPKSGIPSLTRVDSGTVALVKHQGVRIASSAELVQFTKSLWGPRGRVAHYVAMHHLTRLKDQALAHLAAELRAGHSVTEYQLSQFIVHGYQVRGIEGPPPVVAAGAHTANPHYLPGPDGSATIARGDLLLLDLAGRVTDADRPIYAQLAWMAYVGDSVPDRYARVFKTVAAARDAVVSFIDDRVSHRRVVKGFEADQRARAAVSAAGMGDKFVQRTGHSLDSSLFGDGANLDDYETHDTRTLVMGSGFTVGPGVYQRGDFGERSVVDLYIGRKGVEVTGPTQQEITAVLAQ